MARSGAEVFGGAEAELIARARRGDRDAFERLTAGYQRELHLHCYRMVGSLHDAEDLVQETLLRAWRAAGGFESRSSVRTWLYRIATNACLNALAERPRRALPSGLVPSSNPLDPSRDPISGPVWFEPYPDRLLEELDDPAARYARRETLELAFLAAIQMLPPRQRAILLLRDVLEWSAAEVADLLAVSATSNRPPRTATRQSRSTNEARKSRRVCPSRSSHSPAGSSPASRASSATSCFRRSVFPPRGRAEGTTCLHAVGMPFVGGDPCSKVLLGACCIGRPGLPSRRLAR